MDQVLVLADRAVPHVAREGKRRVVAPHLLDLGRGEPRVGDALEAVRHVRAVGARREHALKHGRGAGLGGAHEKEAVAAREIEAAAPGVGPVRRDGRVWRVHRRGARAARGEVGVPGRAAAAVGGKVPRVERGGALLLDPAVRGGGREEVEREAGAELARLWRGAGRRTRWRRRGRAEEEPRGGGGRGGGGREAARAAAALGLGLGGHAEGGARRLPRLAAARARASPRVQVLSSKV